MALKGVFFSSAASMVLNAIDRRIFHVVNCIIVCCQQRQHFFFRFAIWLSCIALAGQTFVLTGLVFKSKIGK
jgi:hypothetical protein